MRKFIASILVSVLITSGSSVAYAQDFQPSSVSQKRVLKTTQLTGLDAKQYIQGEAIVIYKDGSYSHISKNIQAKKVKKLNTQSVQLLETTNPSTEQIIETLSSDPNVASVQPNYTYQTLTTLNDTRFNELWNLHNIGQTNGKTDSDIDALEGWELEGNNLVRVAVIDTGVDRDHPDLINNLATGFDFADFDTRPDDTVGHGTHVSGIIGATANNQQGVTGISAKNNIEIVPLKFNFTTASAIQAINFAEEQGIPIINASWGGKIEDKALENAVKNYSGLFVAAAGNSGRNHEQQGNELFPCDYSFSHVVCVAATTQNDTLASFSDFGKNKVDLAAPGDQILSTSLNGQYTLLSGTSMAAPHVSAIAALLLSKNPNLSRSELKNILMNSGDAISALQSKTVSGKRVNMRNALQTLAPSTPNTQTPETEFPQPATEITNLQFLDATGNILPQDVFQTNNTPLLQWETNDKTQQNTNFEVQISSQNTIVTQDTFVSFLTSPLQDGKTTVTITPISSNNTRGKSQSVSLLVDTTAPQKSSIESITLSPQNKQSIDVRAVQTEDTHNGNVFYIFCLSQTATNPPTDCEQTSQKVSDPFNPLFTQKSPIVTTFSNLQPGTTYFLSVQTQDGLGNKSAFSQTTSFTLPKTPESSEQQTETVAADTVQILPPEPNNSSENNEEKRSFSPEPTKESPTAENDRTFHRLPEEQLPTQQEDLPQETTQQITEKTEEINITEEPKTVISNQKPHILPQGTIIIQSNLSENIGEIRGKHTGFSKKITGKTTTLQNIEPDTYTFFPNSIGGYSVPKQQTLTLEKNDTLTFFITFTTYKAKKVNRKKTKYSKNHTVYKKTREISHVEHIPPQFHHEISQEEHIPLRNILHQRPHIQALPQQEITHISERKTNVIPQQKLTQFHDIETHWAKPYIHKLAAKNAISGRTDSIFAPNAPITRAEFVKLLHSALNQDQEIQEFPSLSLRDVHPSDWFAPYVLWAIEKGMINGYNDQTFRPHAPITRAEALKVLLESNPQTKIQVAQSLHTLPAHYTYAYFTDVNVESWFAKYVVTAINMNMLSRKSPTFAPQKHITRAEAAKLVAQFADFNT